VSHRLPHLLPGGAAVVFTVLKEPWNWRTAQVAVQRFGTPRHVVLVEGAADARYLPTGHLIYLRQGRLMAARFDVTRLTVTGVEVGLIDGVMQSVNVGNTAFDTGAAQLAVFEVGDSRLRCRWTDAGLELAPGVGESPRGSRATIHAAKVVPVVSTDLRRRSLHRGRFDMDVAGPLGLRSPPAWTPAVGDPARGAAVMAAVDA
jgi:hypothetical protein